MPKTYIINTNSTHNKMSEKDMIDNKKCAAYYSPWKYYIDEIEANDIVYLYSNGKGIVARGIASGIPEIRDYQGNNDEEHYMELDRFQLLSIPMEASTITEVVGYKLIYNQTVISLPYRFGIKVWQHITQNCL
jgi:hypothetical protein